MKHTNKYNVIFLVSGTSASCLRRYPKATQKISTIKGNTVVNGVIVFCIDVLPDVAFVIENIDINIDVVKEKLKSANIQNSYPIVTVYYTRRFIWVSSKDM